MWDYPDYDDFYGEPSEFEMQISEFKDSLKQSVSHEWIDKMNALEKENAELQEVKRNFEAIKSDYEKKKRECEWEKERVIKNAEYEARRARLRDLMKDVQKIFWDVSYTYKYGAKCDKCNDNRQISYKTPSGKEAFEDCECAKRIQIIEPRMQMLYEIALRDRNGSTVQTWFQEHKGDDDDYYTRTDYFGEKIVIEDDADFTKLNLDDMNKFYFCSYEKCEDFCDWYNSTIKNIDIDGLSDNRGTPVRKRRVRN